MWCGHSSACRYGVRFIVQFVCSHQPPCLLSWRWLRLCTSGTAAGTLLALPSHQRCCHLCCGCIASSIHTVGGNGCCIRQLLMPPDIFGSSTVLPGPSMQPRDRCTYPCACTRSLLSARVWHVADWVAPPDLVVPQGRVHCHAQSQAARSAPL